MRLNRMTVSLVALVAAGGLVLNAAEAVPTSKLWTGPGPGDGAAKEKERDLTKPEEGLIAGRRLIRLGHVWEPTLAVYKPAADKDTGASVLVCPGGGYHILALDLEGTEVCEWLNSVGVTGVLLKYRVPRREGREKHEAPLQDAQRAMGLMRQHAKEWGLDPARMGVLGFSAGGHLAASLSTHHAQRTYPRVDAADDLSCRPDFAVLIYPGYLTDAEKGDAVAADLSVSTNTPPDLYRDGSGRSGATGERDWLRCRIAAEEGADGTAPVSEGGSWVWPSTDGVAGDGMARSGDGMDVPEPLAPAPLKSASRNKIFHE